MVLAAILGKVCFYSSLDNSDLFGILIFLRKDLRFGQCKPVLTEHALGVKGPKSGLPLYETIYTYDMNMMDASIQRKFTQEKDAASPLELNQHFILLLFNVKL